jgi:hypothetical protein
VIGDDHSGGGVLLVMNVITRLATRLATSIATKLRAMPPKISGPCSVTNCDKKSQSFRSLTEAAYNKAIEKQTLIEYPYLEIGAIICNLHYNDIVESDRAKYHKSNKVYSKNKNKQEFSGKNHMLVIIQYTKYSANNDNNSIDSSAFCKLQLSPECFQNN